MNHISEILLDSLRTSVLVCGLVIVMMMLIELVNVDSKGGLFSGLKTSKFGQVLLSSILGIIPGCMGGFASVSLYTHGIISFGALVAMMIVSSGDEAFVMLAMFPDKSLWIFALLFAIAVAVGLAVDILYHPARPRDACCPGLEVHKEDHEHTSGDKHLSWRGVSFKRAAMFVGVALFITALLSGWLECEGCKACEAGATCESGCCEVGAGCEACGTGACECGGHGSLGDYGGGHGGHIDGLAVNLLSEGWMYWVFGVLSLAVLAVLIFGSDHFVNEHLWNHIVKKHVPSVFLWTFGVLVATGLLLHHCDIASWISSNTALMILLAALIGMIPESGPHLIFVTLFASGVLPVEVLLTSCISQDGHSSLPLLAESKKDFLKAKGINFLVAVVVGFVAMLF